MIFLNTQLVISLITIYILRNFPPLGRNDLLRYVTTSPVVLNNFLTLNLNFFQTIPIRKVLITFTYIKSTALFLLKMTV